MGIKKCNKNICRFVLFLMNCCTNINYGRRMRIFSLESFFQDASNGLGHSYTISVYLGAMEPLKSTFFFKKMEKSDFVVTCFLAATGQLYKRVCRSVCRSVCLSVGRSVLFSFFSFKLRYLSCLWSYWAVLWI